MQNISDSKGFTFKQSQMPSYASLGDTWFNTTDKSAFIYSGKHWIKLSYTNGTGDSYGFNVVNTTKIDRITFPFDSGNATTVGNVRSSNAGHTSFNSQIKGYFCGGNDTIKNLSLIESILFPLNSGNSVSCTNLTSEKHGVAGCNNQYNGYICGGYTTVQISNIDRYNYSMSGSVSNTSYIANTSHWEGSCNSSNYGYIICGCCPLSQISRFDLSLITNSIISMYNPAPRYYNSSSNSSNYGYTYGGYSSTIYLSHIDRIQFSINSGTSSLIGTQSASSTTGFSGPCNSTIHGYICGGQWISSVERLSFPFNSGTSVITGYINTQGYGGSTCDGVDFVSMFV